MSLTKDKNRHVLQKVSLYPALVIIDLEFVSRSAIVSARESTHSTFKTSIIFAKLCHGGINHAKEIFTSSRENLNILVIIKLLNSGSTDDSVEGRRLPQPI